MNEAGEHGVDASHLQDEVDNLADRLDDLQAKLDDRCSELQSAATAVTQFNVSTSLSTEYKVIFVFGRSRFCLTHEVGIFTVFINPFIKQIKMYYKYFLSIFQIFKSWLFLYIYRRLSRWV